jgi:predicted lactoylglutathione lyase
MVDRQPPPLANVITLGVRDLPTLRAFYRQLGRPQVADQDDFAAFELRGTVLALFPVDRLAADGRGRPEPGAGGIRFTVAILVDRAEAVDQLAERMRAAGGQVTKPPVDAEFFAGRSAYACDPEGNFWEIAWTTGDNAVAAAARRAARADT